MMPTTMTLTPEDKPGESTRIVYKEIDFDSPIPDSMFTLQAVKR